MKFSHVKGRLHITTLTTMKLSSELRNETGQYLLPLLMSSSRYRASCRVQWTTWRRFGRREFYEPKLNLILTSATLFKGSQLKNRDACLLLGHRKKFLTVERFLNLYLNLYQRLSYGFAYKLQDMVSTCLQWDLSSNIKKLPQRIEDRMVPHKSNHYIHNFINYLLRWKGMLKRFSLFGGTRGVK